MKKITFLFALICASVMGWATQYCETAVQSTVDNTSVSINVTVKKSGDKTLLVQFESDKIASMRAGGTFQQWGNGAWKNQDDAVANFAADWSQEGNIWSKEFEFSTYPTSGTGQIYALFNLTEGVPSVAGFTLSAVDLSTDCSGGTPEPEPAFSINSVWPTERVTASKSGDDFLVNIASYGGGQWAAQLKLYHSLSFESTKAYKLAFTMTADKDCGGITLKTDDNTGLVWENQSINLIANTPLHYEKVFAGQSGNNITVFDFGWVGENTNITISDLTLVEYSPATASSTNGENIPFKAVDGNAGTRWQAASKGEAWWKMDYGTAQSFNRVNITWEWSYAKSFTIQGSNDDETYTTLKTISGQTIDNANNYKQVIDLDQVYSYRYVKFVGTENGNDYGFSFYEFEILEVEASILTDVVITSPKYKTVCAVGQSIDITAIARDQYEEPMPGQTITYSVSPAANGSIDASGHYTASVVGEVTITATCSDKSASVAVVNTVSGNLALNKTSTAGHNETPIGNANDTNLKSYWSLAPNRPVEEMWWRVDLGDIYDLSLVIIKWEGACPTEHAIQVSTDDANWTDAAILSEVTEVGNDDNDIYQFYPINATGQYIRVKASALRNVGWGMKIYDFQAFGTLAASPTKFVSASVNDEAMGTATVKQGGVDVTEVETGTTVTFSAVANDGYIFVDWSNGETQASFDAIVNTNMNLTANFRALGTVYCNKEIIKNDHTAYVTMKRTGDQYKLIVRSEEELYNFGGTVLYKPDNVLVQDIRNLGVLSDGNHTLTATITSDKDLYFGTPLYVVLPGNVEVAFDALTNIEYAVPCDDNVPVTAISLSQTTANLLIDHSLTLTPTFTPAYATDKELTWESSNSSIATVADGVVTGAAEGDVIITAKLTSDNSIYATCNVHVVASLTEATLHGYEFVSPQEGQTVFTYSITRSVEQKLTFSMTTDKNVVGFVAFIKINGTDHELTGYGAEHTASYTTEATYEDNTPLNCMWDFRSVLYRETIDFTYYVGTENEALKILTIDENVDNTTNIGSFNGQTVELGIVNRSFTADKLYTLVLPFNADAAQTAEKLPGQLMKLNNTYVKDNGDLRVNFVDVDAIEAGVPYLYVPSTNVTNSIFENVTVSSTLVPTEPDDELAKYYGIYDTKDADALKAITHGYVLGSDQYLYDVQDLPSTQTMKSLRGYFVLNFPSAASGAPKRVAKVVFNSNEKEETTGIEDVQDGVQCMKRIENGMLYIIRDGKTYNVQGQLVK